MGLLRPPVALALARDERQVPAPSPLWSYEPKTDGWRSALWTQSGFVQSRRDNNLAQRFPEILAAARGLGDLVLDGELVALRDGRLDFGALASPPRARAAAGVTIYYVTFDLIAEDDRDWRPQPYRARRLRLEQLLAGIEPPLQLSPAPTDQDQAMPWLNPAMAYRGIEGSWSRIATSRTGPVEPATGARSVLSGAAMILRFELLRLPSSSIRSLKFCHARQASGTVSEE